MHVLLQGKVASYWLMTFLNYFILPDTSFRRGSSGMIAFFALIGLLIQIRTTTLAAGQFVLIDYHFHKDTGRSAQSRAYMINLTDYQSGKLLCN
jgi:hypothetical protein